MTQTNFVYLYFLFYYSRNKESFFEFYEVIIWIRNHSSSTMSLVHISTISRHRFTGSQKFSLVSLESYELRYIFVIEEKNIQKYSMQSKIVLPVCFDIICMIFYYQLQNFSISLCTNSVVIYREKKFSLTVFYPNYIQKKREKVFFNFILKQHWIPIAVWWSLNDSVITHKITIRSNVQHLRWCDVMTL